MEQEALLLVLLNKVRTLEQQVQEQKPIVTWAQRYIPKLWFEKFEGRDSLVIGNQAGQNWTTVAKDTYWNQRGDYWVDTREFVLLVSDTALSVDDQRYPVHTFTVCRSTSSTVDGQARLWNFDMGERLYPIECKAQVDAMLWEAAKRFEWEIRHE